MRWLLAPLLRRYVLLAGAASLALNVALLVPALVMLQVFDRVFSSRSPETLVALVVVALLAIAFGYAMDVVRAQALVRAGALLEARLSGPAFERQLRHSGGDPLRDIAQLRQFLSGSAMPAWFDAPWIPIFLLVIVAMHPALGAAAATGALSLMAVGWLTQLLTSNATRRCTTLLRELAQHAAHLSQHADEMRAMGMARAAVRSWRRRQDRLLHTQTQLLVSSASLLAFARALRQVLQLALLSLGAWFVISGDASPGIMVATTTLLARALQPVEQLIAGWKAMVEARASWERLAAQLAAVDATAVCLLPPSGSVEVERILYTGQGARTPMIKGISFTLHAGESLALAGPSGSGKTLLLRLLLGLESPQAGHVRLGGRESASWPREHLGPHIGYLPQSPAAFAGSVAMNIARLGDIDEEQVVHAARLAGVHDMIERLPQGYETLLGAAATTLSQGQLQRIALARAVYGNPRLVLLDEPDAHLDAEGDAALVEMLARLRGRGVTVVVAGHRTALLRQADRVAIMHDGTFSVIGPTAAVLDRLQSGATGVTSLELACRVGHRAGEAGKVIA